MGRKARTPKRLSHPERRVRRLEMAQAVARGQSPEAVASKFHVTAQTVRLACKQANVPLVDRRGKRKAKP